MAAGLSLEECNLDAFAVAFDAEVARWRDPAIPANRVETHRRGDDLRAFFLKAHQRHIELEILDAFGDEDRDTLSRCG